MKTGIIITVKERPEYLTRCLFSLRKADLTDCVILIVDDCSEDKSVWAIIEEFNIPGVEIIKKRHHSNVGVAFSIKLAMDELIDKCDMFMTLDGDTIVAKNFVSKILALPKDGVSTGFNTLVKNLKQQQRHPIVLETENYYIKKSLGGVNVCFSKDVYYKYIQPSLLNRSHWDWEMCRKLEAARVNIYCVKTSVVQHIGRNSAMGHGVIEEYDYAEDFVDEEVLGRQGLITMSDLYVLRDCILHISKLFPTGPIRITEVGVHSGHTSRQLKDFVSLLGRKLEYTAIDAQVDFKMGSPFPEAKFIIGYSNDVYGQIEDGSQHLIFIDANHNLMCTATDFLLYQSKLKPNGLFAFHDTGAHIPAFKDYQHMGDRKNPDNYIACRKALTLLGLYDTPETRGFKLFADKADVKFETGGITAFQKL